MEKARIDDFDLEYQVLGTGEPAIFIHGVIIADAFGLLFSEPSLAEQFRLILYHRRGYAGSSRASGRVTIAQQASDCWALLRYLGVDRAHVVGHSYGGNVGLQLALDFPEVVRTLVLLEPGLFVGASAQSYRESLARSADRYREAGATIAVDEFLEARWPGYQADLDRLLPGALAQAVADAATTFECELPGGVDWIFGEAEARRISQPTLSVLGGESDALWSRFGETHRLLLAWLPHAEEFIMPGSTHLMQVENPRVLAEALAAFWARHRLPAGTS